MSGRESDLRDLGAATDAAVLVDAAERAAAPTPVEAGGVYTVLVPDGATLETVDLEHLLDHPRRAEGAVTAHTPDALIAYVNRHLGAGLDRAQVATIWADVTARRVVAVLNDHTASEAGWGDHRATLTLPHPPAWLRWMARNGRLGGQAEFAEHIEESLEDIVDPPAAEMLELAQSFQARTEVEFRRGERLHSGEVRLTYAESTEARAGVSGELSVPHEFTVALQPFEGSDIYRVRARLRYRINAGKLTIGYVLDRPEEVLRSAFADVCGGVAEKTGLDVWAGVPR